MPLTAADRLKGSEATRRRLTGVARWRARPDAHPLVRLLAEAARSQSVTTSELARRSGVSRDTLKNWNSSRYPSGPRLADIEACFNVLGFSVLVVPTGLADRDQDAKGPPRGMSRRPFQESAVTPGGRNTESTGRPASAST